MKNVLSTYFPALLLSAMTLSCSANQQAINEKEPKQKINNIIMIVADGMGPAYTSAYRYYADNP